MAAAVDIVPHPAMAAGIRAAMAEAEATVVPRRGVRRRVVVIAADRTARRPVVADIPAAVVEAVGVTAQVAVADVSARTDARIPLI